MRRSWLMVAAIAFSACSVHPPRGIDLTVAEARIAKIYSVQLVRRPAGSWGEIFDAIVTVENQSARTAYVSSALQYWTYDVPSKTLVLDYEDEDRPLPDMAGASVGYAAPKRGFPLDVSEIPAHAKIQLKEMLPVVIRKHLLLHPPSRGFATEETDMSGVEHVKVRLTANQAAYSRGESEEYEQARIRFRAWGKAVENTFDATLR